MRLRLLGGPTGSGNTTAITAELTKVNEEHVEPDFTELKEFYGNLEPMLSLVRSLNVKNHRVRRLHDFLLITKNGYQQESEPFGPLYSETEETATNLATAYLDPEAEASTVDALRYFVDDHAMIMSMLGYSYSRALASAAAQRLQRLSESSFTRWAPAKHSEEEYSESEIRIQFKSKIMSDAVIVDVFKNVAQELRWLETEEDVVAYESVPLSWRLSMIGFPDAVDEKFNFGFFYDMLTNIGLDVLSTSDDKKKWAVLIEKE